MKRSWAPLCLTLGAIAVSTPAGSLPISFQVDPALTSVNVGVSTSSGSDTTALALSGSLTGDVPLSSDPSLGLVVTQIAFQGGSLAAAHAPLSIFAPGVSLVFSSSNLAASISGPPISGFPAAPGFSLADFHGLVLSLDVGSLSIVGNVLVDPIDLVFDLGLAPLALVLPLNSIGQIELSAPAPGSTDVAVSIPIDAVTHLLVSGLAVDVTLQGDLALTGSVVPEPGTLLLLGTGLALLGAARRARPAR